MPPPLISEGNPGTAEIDLPHHLHIVAAAPVDVWSMTYQGKWIYENSVNMVKAHLGRTTEKVT